MKILSFLGSTGLVLEWYNQFMFLADLQNLVLTLYYVSLAANRFTTSTTIRRSTDDASNGSSGMLNLDATHDLALRYKRVLERSCHRM